jgi:hypothetical protein
MDSLITACAGPRGGDRLGALNRIAWRGDAPALALRAVAMAQLDKTIEIEIHPIQDGRFSRRQRPLMISVILLRRRPISHWRTRPIGTPMWS